MSDELLKGQIKIADFLAEYNTPKEVKLKGLLDYAYCPVCNMFLEDFIKIKACPRCGHALKWSFWEKLNE